MAIKVTNGDKCLEPCALASPRLLLNGHDLHHLILELGEEEVDDLELLDRQREEIDLLHRLDLSVLHQTAELGNRNPVLV